eukprot:1377723-Prymnesium_polylepis.1
MAQDDHLAGIALLLQSQADPNVCARASANEYNSGEWGRRRADGGLEMLTATAGSSALHMAIDCGAPNSDTIRLLLEHGAGARCLSVSLSLRSDTAGARKTTGSCVDAFFAFSRAQTRICETARAARRCTRLSTLQRSATASMRSLPRCVRVRARAPRSAPSCGHAAQRSFDPGRSTMRSTGALAARR